MTFPEEKGAWMTAVLRARGYQQEALDAIERDFAEGCVRVAVVLATGLGKTHVFAHAIAKAHEHGLKSLVLVHREELAQQAKTKIHSVAPSLSIGIVKAELNEIDADVIVASVQTLANPLRRESVMSAGEIGFVVCDEAHHSVSRTWMEILEAFGCFESTPCLGVTATMTRNDGKGLGDVWQKISYEKDILYGIDHGYLTDVRGQQVTVDGLDLATIARSRGDYQEGQLGEAMISSGAAEVVAQSYLEHAKDRQGVLFAPTVQSAHEFAAGLNAAGIVTETITGTMGREERELIYKRYEHGDVQVLSNVMVLCLDTETEILTDQGWTRYDEMTEAHKVANWNQGAVHFIEPREIVVRDRGEYEDMYVLESPKRSIRVTRGHRMLYRTYAGGQWHKAPVEELAGRALKLPTTGMAEPEHPSDLTLDEAALVGFWLGDGSINRPSGGIEYTMSQSNAYPEIIRWVDDLLDRVGIDYRRYDKSHYPTPHVRWSLARGTGYGPQSRRGVQRFEGFLDKSGPSALSMLNGKQFDAFLTGLWYADGNHGAAADGRPESGFAIYGATLSFMEMVQAVATVRGWTCSLRKETAPRDTLHRQVYRLSFSRRPQHHTTSKFSISREEAPWSPEKVWCVKTETRNIITRRRGSVTVMGNTEGWDAPWCSAAVIARPTQSASLYTQMVGRVLRPWPGKDDALVLDVVGIAGRHKLQSLVDLVKTEVQDGESYAEARQRIEEEIRQRVDAPEKIKGAVAAQQVELFANSHSVWLQTRGGTWFIPVTYGVFFLWPALQEMGDQPGTFRLGYKTSKRGGQREKGWIETGLTLEYAMAWGETLAELDDPTISQKDREWRRRKPSAAQIDFAVKIHAASAEDAMIMRKGALSDAISIALASRMLDI